MPYTPNSTWVDGSGGGTPLSAARLNNLESGVTWTWENWTPTWSCESGSAPSIGNGSLTGRYIQRGKYVTATMTLLAGTTTTFGSGGVWLFSYPVTPSGDIGGSIKLLDNAVANYLGLPSRRDSTSFYTYVWATGGSYAAAANVTNTAPFAWGNSDRLDAWFEYEAA